MNAKLKMKTIKEDEHENDFYNTNNLVLSSKISSKLDNKLEKNENISKYNDYSPLNAKKEFSKKVLNNNINNNNNIQFNNFNDANMRAINSKNTNTDINKISKNDYKNLIGAEVFEFVEELANNQIIKENKNKKKNNKREIKYANESKVLNLGLSDNQNVDFETKSKAQKGLLFLLNKVSGGTFLPEIGDYIKKKKEEFKHQKKLSLEEKETENEKNEIINKRKQHKLKHMTNIFNNENFNNIFKDEENLEFDLKLLGSKINSESKENLSIYKKNSLIPINLKRKDDKDSNHIHLKNKAFKINKNKQYNENKDEDMNLYLKMYFSNKEADNIVESNNMSLKNNEKNKFKNDITNRK